MNDQFRDKVVFITGGARGIGKGTAEVFSERGAKLAISDLDGEELERLETEFSSKGTEIIADKVDVTVKKDIEEFVKRTINEFGKIDVCVPNAGAIGSSGFSDRKDYNDEDWDITYKVNVKGLVNTTDSVKGHMIERESGKIVIVSSQGGRKPRGVGDKGRGNVLNPYLVSKAAAIQFTHALAIELGRFNINVNTVCPGRLWTSFWQKIAENHKALNPDFADMDPYDIFVDQIKSNFPLGRPQEPRDIGNAIAFLASEDASQITGQALNVNGGNILD
ncbi:MAG: 3-ketoacyl-ACP reductase [Dehalococcoidia bacterium]|nr:3-ketoacyl-ACP reductase [Dehalococcoidia bacterium]MBH60755.1 3-ketoacyl-ACP reductase [Dehalococcoidia bacterium]|tara:strand:- start:2771 stop:3601 length:831 start_codon:yes stop_codon:yes gene_type:complete